MSHNGCCARAGDSPVEILDKHNVEQEVHHIVDNHCQRHQFGAAVHAHHRRESPHHDERRVANEQHLHVVLCQRQEVLVVAQHPRRGSGQQQSAHDGEQHSQSSAQGESTREVLPCFACVLLAQGIGHKHSCTGVDEQVQSEDKLVDGFRQGNGAHAVLADEVSHDDTVHHISQAPRERHQNIGPQVAIELLVYAFLAHLFLNALCKVTNLSRD